jgi:hypothetical protein
MTYRILALAALISAIVIGCDDPPPAPEYTDFDPPADAGADAPAPTPDGGPPDPPACWRYECTSGACAMTAAPQASQCVDADGASGVCDSGACVTSCDEATDCPWTSCHDAVCQDGQCGYAQYADGTPCNNAWTVGTCASGVCVTPDTLPN